MVSDPKINVGKRRRLAPSEKYEIYVAVLTGQATQREAAERFGVDRSTVVHVCRTAKQGALAALAEHWPPRCRAGRGSRWRRPRWRRLERRWSAAGHLSLIHISEPTRLGMISYAVFCLKKKKSATTT